MGNQNVLSIKPNFFSINFIMDAAVLIQMLLWSHPKTHMCTGDLVIQVGPLKGGGTFKA